MKGAILSILTIILLYGCGSSIRSVKLDSLNPSMPYDKLHKKLTVRSDYDTGLFLEVRAYATLLVPAMRQYRSDIPEEGTVIEFNIEGTPEDFVISKMVLNIEDGAGNKLMVDGIGTSKQNNKDVKFIPLERESVRVGTETSLEHQQEGLVTEMVAYKHFVIILPFKITEKTKYLSITGMDLVKPKNKINFAWYFK